MKNVGPQAHQSVLHRSSISCPPEPGGGKAKLVTGKIEANKAMPVFCTGRGHAHGWGNKWPAAVKSYRTGTESSNASFRDGCRPGPVEIPRLMHWPGKTQNHAKRLAWDRFCLQRPMRARIRARICRKPWSRPLVALARSLWFGTTTVSPGNRLPHAGPSKSGGATRLKRMPRTAQQERRRS